MLKQNSQNQIDDQKLQRLQKRLEYKKNWFAQKIQHYQERMKTYSENKIKQIEGCRQAISTTALPKSKVS